MRSFDLHLMEAKMNLGSTFRHWQRRRAELDALDALGTEGRQTLAHDLGLSESCLVDLATRKSGTAKEFQRLLSELGVDFEQLKVTHPSVVRDMEVVCSRCDEKSSCRTDLELGVSAATYDEYCPNAGTI